LKSLALKVSGGHLRAATLICFAGAVSFLLAGYLAKDDGQERVTASLTALGPVDFVLDAAPGTAVSPVCGCFKIKHRKDWRGVTFAAREVQVSRDTGDLDSTYVITAANPEPATWEPGDFYFRSELLTFERSIGGFSRARFNSKAIVGGSSPVGWRLLERRRLGPQEEIQMTTSSPLNVSMLGPTPIGAWVPSIGGRVHLTFSQGLTANAPVRGELTEASPHPSRWGALDHPLADFLGPDVGVWVRDRGLSVEAAESAIAVPRGRGREVVSALRIRQSPFATRVAAMPFLIPPRLTPPGKVVAGSPWKTSGPYRLRLGGRQLTHADYTRIQRRFRTHNVLWLKNLIGWKVAPRLDGKPYVARECTDGRCHVWVRKTVQRWKKPVKFRYPPRPPVEQGFTVFGPLRSLHLAEAKGVISSQQPMLTPTDVRLRDVELLGPSVEGALPIPADEKGYELDLSASTSGTVGHRSLVDESSFGDEVAAALPILGVIATVLALYFAALSYLNRVR
jgi:hypothetical protein